MNTTTTTTTTVPAPASIEPAADHGYVQMPCAMLRRVLGNGLLYCSDDLTRGALASVLLEQVGETLTMVATDSYTLVWEELAGHELETSLREGRWAIRAESAKAFLALLRVTNKKAAGPVVLRFPAPGTPRGVIRVEGAATFELEISDAEFPTQWRQLVPGDDCQVQPSTFALDPALLARLAKLEPANGVKRGDQYARFTFGQKRAGENGQALGPIGIEIGGTHVLQMPVRTS